jgi:hypothetical protein
LARRGRLSASASESSSVSAWSSPAPSGRRRASLSPGSSPPWSGGESCDVGSTHPQYDIRPGPVRHEKDEPRTDGSVTSRRACFHRPWVEAFSSSFTAPSAIRRAPGRPRASRLLPDPRLASRDELDHEVVTRVIGFDDAGLTDDGFPVFYDSQERRPIGLRAAGTWVLDPMLRPSNPTTPGSSPATIADQSQRPASGSCRRSQPGEPRPGVQQRSGRRRPDRGRSSGPTNPSLR